MGVAAAAVGAAASAGSAINGIVSGGGSGSQSQAISTGQTQATSALAPYLSAGTNALTQQASLLGLNGPDAASNALATFSASPGYQYQVTQGLQAVDHGAAAAGTLQSGNTIRAEQTLGTNLANQDFSNYYNRLAGVASSGLTAGTSTASIDTGAANAQSNIIGNQSAGVNTALNSLANNATTALNSNGTTNALQNLNLALGTGKISSTATQPNALMTAAPTGNLDGYY